jgi:SAM-dependent methyltransferase
VLAELVTHVRLGAQDLALDLGAGTGQVAVPPAARLAGVLAVEPEPDMLVQLRRRAEEEREGSLAGSRGRRRRARFDPPEGGGRLRVADGGQRAALDGRRHGLRLRVPVAALGRRFTVITHGRPLWLGERDWTLALRGFLVDWFGPVSGGTDEATLAERRRLLGTAGHRRHHAPAPVHRDAERRGRARPPASRPSRRVRSGPTAARISPPPCAPALRRPQAERGPTR